jgi:hypothetical protein
MPESPSDIRPDVPAKRSTIAFLLACCIFLIFMELIGLHAMRNLSSGPDFRSFYAAGYMVRTQPSQLYDLAQQKQVQDTLIYPTGVALPFFHPAYEALVYAPFSFLHYRAAYFSFIAFNVLLLAGVFFAIRPSPLQGMLLFLFAPVLVAVWQGQDSILFLLLCCLAWRQLRNAKDASAGCLLALALFRFQLTIPIAILIAIRRGWRFSLGFLITAAGVVALCVGIVGRTGVVSLIHLLSAGSLSSDQGSVAQRTMAIYPLAMPNLLGLLYACGSRMLSSRLSFGIAIAASLALFLWCLYRTRREPRDTVAFAVAILCSVLVSYHLYLHDASLLLLPMALLTGQVHRITLLVCYCLPLILFLFAGPNWFFLLAIPTMALLFDAQMFGEKNARESVSTSFNTAPVTPLYTQD